MLAATKSSKGVGLRPDSVSASLVTEAILPSRVLASKETMVGMKLSGRPAAFRPSASWASVTCTTLSGLPVAAETTAAISSAVRLFVPVSV
ncbi:hypothetical protein D9M69_646570 [compost metagenome]